MTVFGSKVLKAYVILMWSGAVPWWWGGGGEKGHGGTPPPPPPPPMIFIFFFFFSSFHLFYFSFLFFSFFFFFSFVLLFFIFFFYCCLSAQSPVMYIDDDNTLNPLFYLPQIFSGLQISQFFYPPPLFFACQLRAQSCTLMMIIPLTHYDHLATNYFQVGGLKCVTVPFLHPPFFFCLSAKRSILYVLMLMMITPLPHYDKFVHKFFQVGGGGGGECLGPLTPRSDLLKMWIGYPIVFCYCIRG